MGLKGPLAKTHRQAWDSLLKRARRAENGCLLIEDGGSVGMGYKRIRAGGREWFAHQLSFFIHNGRITRSLAHMHSCDTPNCIEPTHISEGTHADNVRDKVAKGRQKRNYKW